MVELRAWDRKVQIFTGAEVQLSGGAPGMGSEGQSESSIPGRSGKRIFFQDSRLLYYLIKEIRFVAKHISHHN